MAIEQTDFRTTMRSVRRLTPILILLSATLNLLLLVGAIYMLQIYDRVLTSGSHDTLIWLTAIGRGASSSLVRPFGWTGN